jgi:predicted DsbA family dithiol-disulfide isomerase
MSKPLIIDYYSDVLCVWAWIAQRRIEELEEQWGDQILLRHHYMNLFGDTTTRMEQQWSDRGGFEGFGQHVLEAAAPYANAPVANTIWQQVRPSTSATAHLVLKATTLACGEEKSAALATELRKAFFVDTVNIGELPAILGIARTMEIDPARLRTLIDNGEAMAALMSDYKLAQENNVKGSPTWIMNNGRQILYGNVGYRVLHANIEEILKHPEQEASWC